MQSCGGHSVTTEACTAGEGSCGSAAMYLIGDVHAMTLHMHGLLSWPETLHKHSKKTLPGLPSLIFKRLTRAICWLGMHFQGYSINIFPYFTLSGIITTIAKIPWRYRHQYIDHKHIINGSLKQKHCHSDWFSNRGRWMVLLGCFFWHPTSDRKINLSLHNPYGDSITRLPFISLPEAIIPPIIALDKTIPMTLSVHLVLMYTMQFICRIYVPLLPTSLYLSIPH